MIMAACRKCNTLSIVREAHHTSVGMWVGNCPIVVQAPFSKEGHEACGGDLITVSVTDA